MHSWQGLPGQPGADDQQNSAHPNGDSWTQDYAFHHGDDHFDPNQDWSQSLPGQVPYQHHIDTPGSASFFEAHSQHHHNGGFIADNVHPQQAAFSAPPGSLDFSQQYQPPTQDAIDPSFNDIHPDLYSQPGKGGVPGGQEQTQSLHSFQQRDYAFGQTPERQYSDASSQRYQQTHILPQHAQPNSHGALSQQFQHETPGQHETDSNQGQLRHSSAQSHQDFGQHAAYVPPQANGHPAHLLSGVQASFQQQQQPVYSQAPFQSPKPILYQQSPAQGQGTPHIHSTHATSGHPVVSQVAETGTQSPQLSHADSPVSQSAPIDSAPKKRKRTIKTAPDTPSSDVISFQLDSHIDNSTSKLAEIDSLPPPLPTKEEVELINKFNKRTKAAKAKFPPVQGLPYLVHGGTVTLPTPKSFDKLAPLVALPPRSGKRVVPELDYELPCQIQGRFSSQYQPSSDKAGLDERKAEAQVLLDEYDRSMRAIGKRQPKYTEYPHAFKEQLKADEANKNKAGKKAKKDGETNQRNKPIRSETRPIDPVEAAAWDAIGIVHIEPSVTRSTSLIATRVQQTGDFFIKLRGEMNRAKQELDQATIDKAPETEIATLNKEYELKKRVLYQALDAVIEHADDAVLDNLGGHQKLISSLVNVLISCIKAGDFSGKLPKVALELFTQMPMTRKIAETTNFETVRKRFAEKGDNEAKELAREIAMKVKKALKPAEADSTGGYAGTSNRGKVATAKTSDGASTKRSRDEDSSDSRSVKKVIVEAGSSSLSKKLAPVKATGPSATKVAVAKAAPSSILPGKPRPTTKPAVKVAEPAKGDGPSTTAKDDLKMDAKRPTTKTSTASSSSLSGIGSLLASIETPKPESSAPVTKEAKRVDSLETPEQRAKRLRKEARRKLRVSWKPEGELVKVKIFEKEDSEDEGRAHNMIKDAADDRSEGMVLKQRADIDEDDEDDDIPYQPWEEPTKGVWTALPEQARNKNYVTRGGNVTFTTEEQERIREREMRELMVFYHDVADIPPSPKSPPPETVPSSQGAVVNFPSDDKFQELQLRWRDESQMGPDGALYSAIRRLDALQGSSNKLDAILGRVKGAASSTARATSQAQTQTEAFTPSNAPLLVGPAAEEQLLAWLTSEKTRNWRDPTPKLGELRPYHYADPETRLAGAAIEALVRYLAPKPYPATSPPDWLLSDEERVREWWLGYNKEVMAKQKKLEDERVRAEAQANGSLAQVQAQNPQDWMTWYAQQQQAQAQQPQAQQQASYMALLQQVAGSQPSAQTTTLPPHLRDDQLQSILSAIAQPGQPQASGQAHSFPIPSEDPVQKYLAQLAHGQHQQGGLFPPPPPPPATQDRGKERDWERGDEDDRDWDRDRDLKGEGGRGKKMRTLPPHKPINKALIGTKPCTFWQQGKCARGDQCTFRHD